MKKLFFMGLAISILLLTTTMQAEADLATQPNVTAQPAWGPVGYRQVEYYYLPDIESYFSVSTRQFIYLDGGRWIFANKLPPRYAKYDLYTGYKVVVNRPRPYLDFNRDKVQYAKFRCYRGRQVLIRDAKAQKDETHKDAKGDFGP